MLCMRTKVRSCRNFSRRRNGRSKRLRKRSAASSGRPRPGQRQKLRLGRRPRLGQRQKLRLGRRPRPGQRLRLKNELKLRSSRQRGNVKRPSKYTSTEGPLIPTTYQREKTTLQGCFQLTGVNQDLLRN